MYWITTENHDNCKNWARLLSSLHPSEANLHSHKRQQTFQIDAVQCYATVCKNTGRAEYKIDYYFWKPHRFKLGKDEGLNGVMAFTANG